MNLRKIFQASVLALLFSSIMPSYTQAANTPRIVDTTGWKAWLQELKAETIEKGISPEVASVLDTLEFDQSVINLDERQPSKIMSFPEYKSRAVSQSRIDGGRIFYDKHKEELEHFAREYGISAPVMVALLGIESDYGGFTGEFDIIRSLATLAYGSKRNTEEDTEKRKSYFRSEIYYALKMIQDGIVDPDNFIGSWAGASGINQHMPGTYYEKVVDGDNDGDRDIWDKNDLSDTFATMTNHLKEVGWKTGQRWGRRVKLPPDFPDSLEGRHIKKPLQEWADEGVTLPDGSPLPVVKGMQGSIIVPKGGPAYIGYDNFHALRRWNQSNYFVLVVGSLADQIAAGIEP